MNVLVCVKRIAATGGRIFLTSDGSAVDTRHLGFTISPHEECAVEEAVRLVEAFGGTSTVLTLGPDAAVEQLRDALAMGINSAMLLETDGSEWDPATTAAAIADAVRAREAATGEFGLLLFGNEAADSGDYQVGVRVAVALDRPCISGVKALRLEGRVVTGRRERDGGVDVFQADLPAVVTVREGINVARYPSVPGRLRARKVDIDRTVMAVPDPSAARARRVGLTVSAVRQGSATIVGTGPDAAPAVVDLLARLGVVAP